MGADPPEQAWNDLDFEPGFRSGEPEPPPPPPPPTAWQTTEGMLEELRSKAGLDVSKITLPARSWTPDEAFDALTAAGITGNHFTLPGDKPKTREQRLYPGLVRK